MNTILFPRILTIFDLKGLDSSLGLLGIVALGNWSPSFCSPCYTNPIDSS